MHIHDTLQSGYFNEIDCATNFLAARMTALTVLLCYAKITPAALQRDIFARDVRKDREALGPLPKFAFNDSVLTAAGTTPSIVPGSPMACC
jgi:hypothetical protein